MQREGVDSREMAVVVTNHLIVLEVPAYCQTDEKKLEKSGNYRGSVFFRTFDHLVFSGREQIGVARRDRQTSNRTNVARQSELESSLGARTALGEIPHLYYH